MTRCGVAIVVGLLVAVALPTGAFSEGPVPSREAAAPGALTGADAERASQLEQQINDLHRAGKYQEALESANEVLELRKLRQSETHWETVTAHWNQRTLARLAELPADSIAEYQSLVRLDEEVEMLGRQHRFAGIIPLREKKLEISRRVLGGEYPFTARCQQQLAEILFIQGQYPQAIHEFEQTLEQRRRLLGEGHPDVASTYDGLAGSLASLNRFPEAEENALAALSVREQALGADHRDTSQSRRTLARILEAQGRFAEARPHYQHRLMTWRRTSGENSLEVATSYNELGVNLFRQGKYTEAQALHERALAICRTIRGEKNPETANSYNNLAVALSCAGELEKAQALHERALKLREAMFGEMTPTGLAYLNLAANLKDQGKFDEAQPLHQKALEILLREYGVDHAETGAAYNNLGTNLYQQGRFAEAQEQFEKALEVLRTARGENYPYTVSVQKQLAESLFAQGRESECWSMLQRLGPAFNAARNRIAFGGLERANWTAEHSPFLLMAVVAARLERPDEAWEAYEQYLGRGLWDELSERRSKLLLPAESNELRQVEKELRRLEQLLTFALPPEEREQHLRTLDALAVRFDELRAQLAEKYGPPGGDVYDRQQIQAELPPDAAFLAWVDAGPYHPGAADPDGEHLAIMLRKHGAPTVVRLRGRGEDGQWTADDLKLGPKLRSALSQAARKQTWTEIASQLRELWLAPLLPELAKSIPGLPPVRHVIVLPSPALAGIPVEILRSEQETWTVGYAPSATVYSWLRMRGRERARPAAGLLAIGDPVFRSATRDARSPVANLSPSRGLLIETVRVNSNAMRSGLRPGDILLTYDGTPLKQSSDFHEAPADGTEDEIAVELWREGNSMTLSVAPGPLGADFASAPGPAALEEWKRIEQIVASRTRDDSLVPLPGSAWEVASVAKRFQDAGQSAQSFLGAEAREQTLQELAVTGQLKSYQYLHVASHALIDDRLPERSAVVLTQVDLPDPLEQIHNNEPVYDGRLSMAEISTSWDLHADLVTFSTCQSALGKQSAGEGYVGFTQALLLSGADTVCLSLWKVGDAPTALLMDRFYANLLGQSEGLSGPLPKAEALAEAKAWLRQLSSDEAAKRIKLLASHAPRGVGRVESIVAEDALPYEHPYYWAGFILIGKTE